MAEKDKVVDYYDQFVTEQERRGVNSRHLHILDKLIAAGLKRHHHVLEVGCGIGTVSHLMAIKAKKGSVLAVDISPESIEKAKILWKKHKNLTFKVSDMQDFNEEGRKFDFFVFPDVLEHIPVEQHYKLFETVKKHAHTDAVIFINIPSPRFLQWMIQHEPQKLQVIDQPLDTAELIHNLSQNGFYLHKMETYSVFYEENDYQYFVLKIQKPIEKTTLRNKLAILTERINIRLRNGFKY
ncbi:class I SAM-dependent methyltransferase [Anditalea andensis]|uniref:Methyltransferase n=1 Tax=Anditalea andensis TaxID=1048983 RepID=A0A074KVT6_9BACT|nr:class I SAM-dependent methyltransferase [Anditalea andensis]KEO72375.1 methyltransferase [Anditalea andensis]